MAILTVVEVMSISTTLCVEFLQSDKHETDYLIGFNMFFTSEK